jgi:hypothetical protein
MDALDRIREVARVRCVWLRTKAMYLNLPDPGVPENEHSTAYWWCLRNGEALGPDGRAACPGDCDRPGRSCYEPPVRP